MQAASYSGRKRARRALKSVFVADDDAQKQLHTGHHGMRRCVFLEEAIEGILFHDHSGLHTAQLEHFLEEPFQAKQILKLQDYGIGFLHAAIRHQDVVSDCRYLVDDDIQLLRQDRVMRLGGSIEDDPSQNLDGAVGITQRLDEDRGFRVREDELFHDQFLGCGLRDAGRPIGPARQALTLLLMLR